MQEFFGEYITEAQAKELTGYKRTTLYNYRVKGVIRWNCSKSGRKIQYHKADLLRVIGFETPSIKEKRKVYRNEYLSINKACQIFSISRWKLRRNINKYKLKEIKKGRQTLVKYSELKKVFEPKFYIGKRKLNSSREASEIKHTVIVTIKCLGFTQRMVFTKKQAGKQLKWIKDQKKIHFENQRLFGLGRASDWGKLYYLAVNNLHPIKS